MALASFLVHNILHQIWKRRNVRVKEGTLEPVESFRQRIWTRMRWKIRVLYKVIKTKNPDPARARETFTHHFGIQGIICSLDENGDIVFHL